MEHRDQVPFLDFNVVETAMSIPTKDKIQQGKTKIIFKDAIKNLIPELILHRKIKSGLIHRWMNFSETPRLLSIAQRFLPLNNLSHDHSGKQKKSRNYLPTMFRRKKISGIKSSNG